MNRFRFLVCAAVLAAAIVVVPQAAFAAGPATSPTDVHSETFESATMPGLTLAPHLGASPSPAFWGRVTQRKSAGSWGLWCAGSVTATPSLDAWTTWAGLFPVDTYGFATLDVPELAGYYSASVECSYTLPSLGSMDPADAFRVHWWRTADEADKDWDQVVTVAAGWHPIAYDLSAPGNLVNLSRTAGTVRFQFYAGVGASGEGATIDDLHIRGFKFGPARSLTATVTAGHVALDWQTPLRSTAPTTATEERPVAYRVWRAPDVSPYVWTELTSSSARIDASSFEDTSPPDGYLRYVVQAWDPGTGTGYGRVVLPTDSVRIGFGDLTPPVLATSITIKTSATTARIGSIPILSGAVTPFSTVGKVMVVYVMKPGKTYWTYSSNRTVYVFRGSAAWLYKYYFKPGMVKGYYKFKAVMPAYAGQFLTSTSPTTVSIQLR